jgi:hypothetical protein
MNSIYNINKGINKPIEFKGLKAQYIWYLAGGLLVLLILFAILYICGVNPFLCVGLILTAGGFFVAKVYRVSNKYGEHGMMKKYAKRIIPHSVKSNSRKIFLDLKNSVQYGKEVERTITNFWS